MLAGTGTAAAGGAMSSTFKRPHFAAEVQDFLQNRATPDEAQRVERFIDLIQKAAGVPATNAAAATSTKHKPRPATTQGCFPTKHQQQQQQQLKRLSMASEADSALCGPATANNTWLYTTTAAAANNLRPHSAMELTPRGAPIAQHSTATTAVSAKAQAFRPGAAAVPAAPSAHDPKTGAHPPLGSSLKRSSLKSGGLKSVNITTSQAMHGLKDLYPDLWASTVPICRPDPAPNKNFISEWGESLRQGAGEAWKPYLATTSQLANLQVAKPTDEFAVRADEALIGWVAKQQTHFADLLTPQAAAAVAALLEGKPAAAGSSNGSSGSSGLSLGERKELVQVLRQLAAVVQPDRAKSTSHVLHCKQTSVEEATTTALLKEQTRIKTMGFPRKVSVKGFRPVSSTAALGSAAASAAAGVSLNFTPDRLADAVHGSSGSNGGGRAQSAAGSSGSNGALRKPSVKASEMIDTQKSRVPLKWAASNLVPPCSMYTSAHGAHPGRSPQMFRTKFREVNVGMGHVDQHLYPPGSQVYPVETLYLGLPAKCRPQAQDVKTTYRSSFPAAS